MGELSNVMRTLGSTILANKERADWDYYSTDQQAINDLLAKMPILRSNDWKALEPCAGGGHLADRYEQLTHNKMDMYDICARREDIGEMDYMKLDCKDKYNLIISNFPYKEGTSKAPNGFSELLNKALNDVAPGGYVCSFQRLLQLESKKRYEKIYGKRKPEKIFVYSHRMKCYANGNIDNAVNSAIAYCWMVWHKDENGFFSKTTELDWIY